MLLFKGEIWLPNMKCVAYYIKEYSHLINQYYTITLAKQDEIFSNPLVLATENINEKLIKDNPCPLVNSNQLIKLDKKFPFIKLSYDK